MIIGKVSAEPEAIVELEVQGVTEQALRIKAVVDTGYTGALTLPAEIIAALELPFAGHRKGTLADGRTTVLNAYLGRVNWHGKGRDSVILETEGASLIGMSLLRGSRLTMDIVEGGDVLIDERW